MSAVIESSSIIGEDGSFVASLELRPDSSKWRNSRIDSGRLGAPAPSTRIAPAATTTAATPSKIAGAPCARSGPKRTFEARSIRAKSGNSISAGAPGAGVNPRAMALQTEAFSWNVPDDFNFARDVIDRLATEDRRGLLFVDAAGKQQDFTFAQIAQASQKWAAALRDAGVAKGDRVIIVLPKLPQWLFAMLGLLRIGAVAIPGAEQLRAKDLLFRATHSGATTVIAPAANADDVDLIRPDAPDVKRFLIVG